MAPLSNARAAIWFDFGGVLSPPIQALFDAYERKTGITPAQLQAAMADVAALRGQHPLAAIELAQITEAQWGRELALALNRIVPGIDLSRCDLERFGARWFEEIEVNTDMVDLLHRMKARGHQVGILTNNVVEWEPHWRKIVGLDHVVDAIVDSCRVGTRKPEAEIFLIAQAEFGLPAHRTVLIDDLPENCAAARANGWEAIQFRSNEETTDALLTLLDDWDDEARTIPANNGRAEVRA